MGSALHGHTFEELRYKVSVLHLSENKCKRKTAQLLEVYELEGMFEKINIHNV